MQWAHAASVRGVRARGLQALGPLPTPGPHPRPPSISFPTRERPGVLSGTQAPSPAAALRTSLIEVWEGLLPGPGCPLPPPARCPPQPGTLLPHCPYAQRPCLRWGHSPALAWLAQSLSQAAQLRVPAPPLRWAAVGIPVHRCELPPTSAPSAAWAHSCAEAACRIPRAGHRSALGRGRATPIATQTPSGAAAPHLEPPWPWWAFLSVAAGLRPNRGLSSVRQEPRRRSGGSLSA